MAAPVCAVEKNMQTETGGYLNLPESKSVYIQDTVEIQPEEIPKNESEKEESMINSEQRTKQLGRIIIPETGDLQSLGIYLLVLFGAGDVFVTIYKRRKEQDD
jgi:hypothetical protein